MTASIQLHVEPLGDGRWRVTGGSEPHLVELDTRSGALTCDCGSYRFRGARCKHAQAVERVENIEPQASDTGGGPGLETGVPLPEAP